jgi:nicotinamidase-related amidase
MPSEPHSAETVVENAAKLIDAFQKKGTFVTLVHVPRPDESSLRPVLDNKEDAPAADFPSDWDEIVPQIKNYNVKHIIIKRQW